MEKRFVNVIFTNHALKRLSDRRIAQSDVWYTLKHPEKILTGKTLGLKKFYRNYGQQRIEVIAKLNEKREWVILSCWSKMIGSGKPIFRSPALLEKIVAFFVKKIFSVR